MIKVDLITGFWLWKDYIYKEICGLDDGTGTKYWNFGE